MPFLTRATLTALATTTLLALNSEQGPRWPGLEDLAALLRQFSDVRHRADYLADYEARLRHRTRLKEELVRELAAGHLTLPQAAARLREVSADSPEVRDAVERFSESGSEEEKWCRYLIGWIEGSLCETPETTRATADRLRSQLDKLLRGRAPRVGG